MAPDPCQNYPTGAKRHLSDETKQRLAQADWLVGRWIVGELPVETIIEEVHTVAEAVLRSATKSPRGTRWPQLVKNAREMRLLTSDDVAVLTRFSRVHRNRLKHEAGILAKGEDDQALVGDVVLVLDHVERFGDRPLTDEMEADLAELKNRMTALEAEALSKLRRDVTPIED
jgi:hypothetical protein